MQTTGPSFHGKRDELIKELRDMSEGWWHLAKDKQSYAASEGADQLESGAVSSVQVGHTTYFVTD